LCELPPHAVTASAATIEMAMTGVRVCMAATLGAPLRAVIIRPAGL
jgi:hypothetical protein